MNIPKDPVATHSKSQNKPSDSSAPQNMNKAGNKNQGGNFSKSTSAPHSQQQANRSAPGSANQQKNHQPSQGQQQQGLASGDQMKAKWHQYLGDAKATWGKLTDDEFLELEGNTQKLAGLVEERYAISKEAAQKQVKKFVAACEHS